MDMRPEQKIVLREQALSLCNAWHAEGHKVVFTNGCFDILHRGHLDYLFKAASLGSRLVIGLNTDASVRALKGPERPVNRQEDRAYALACLSCTSAIVLFNEATPAELIEALKPDVLVKGGDYTLDRIVGAKETLERGGRVEVIPFVEGYSTTGLIDKIRKAL